MDDYGIRTGLIGWYEIIQVSKTQSSLPAVAALSTYLELVLVVLHLENPQIWVSPFGKGYMAYLALLLRK